MASVGPLSLLKRAHQQQQLQRARRGTGDELHYLLSWSPAQPNGATATAALQPRPPSPAVPPRPASAPPQKDGRTPRRSASYNSSLSSLDERVRWTTDKQQHGTPPPQQQESGGSGRSRSGSAGSDKQFEV